MNNQIRDVLSNRVTIVENIDNLVKYGNDFKKNLQQLSLFGNSIEAKPKLSEINNINYYEAVTKEKNILGICLTYNIFDKYFLIKKRFCNNTISSLNEMTEDCPSGIILLSSINDIEYRTSLAGNKYAKLQLQDYDSSCGVYLWGSAYQKNISKIFKDRIYLIELGYNKDNESVFIINIRPVDDINPQEYISTIILGIDKSNTVKTREYVFKNMFMGTTGDYNLIFRYSEVDYAAPYKIIFNEEHYLYLKDLNINIEIQK